MAYQRKMQLQKKIQITTVQEESKRIQTLAGNSIKAEIRECEFNKETNSRAADIANLNWSPPLLRHFL